MLTTRCLGESPFQRKAKCVATFRFSLGQICPTRYPSVLKVFKLVQSERPGQNGHSSAHNLAQKSHSQTGLIIAPSFPPITQFKAVTVQGINEQHARSQRKSRSALRSPLGIPLG